MLYTVSGDSDTSVHRSAKYKKIKGITVSSDKCRIIVKKRFGKVILLADPKQCDYIVRELQLRCNNLEVSYG